MVNLLLIMPIFTVTELAAFSLGNRHNINVDQSALLSCRIDGKPVGPGNDTQKSVEQHSPPPRENFLQLSFPWTHAGGYVSLRVPNDNKTALAAEYSRTPGFT